MAPVPMRMAQPGLVAPHQQRPPMMVSMTQPSPVSMQGLVSMAPMMAPTGGMAVMTQAMSHPDSGHDHHSLSTPYHPHHPPHHPPPPRPHAPPQAHHPPPHPSAGPPQPPPSGPPHSQYHPPHHPPAPHPHGPHHSAPHHSGPHSGLHSGPPPSGPHSHSGPHSGPHMPSHTGGSSGGPHSGPHGAPSHPQHLQTGPPPHMPPHSLPHHTTSHQMAGLSTGSFTASQHLQQHPQQHHHQPPQQQHQQPPQQHQQPPQQHHQQPSQPHHQQPPQQHHQQQQPLHHQQQHHLSHQQQHQPLQPQQQGPPLPPPSQPPTQHHHHLPMHQQQQQQQHMTHTLQQQQHQLHQPQHHPQHMPGQPQQQPHPPPPVPQQQTHPVSDTGGSGGSIVGLGGSGSGGIGSSGGSGVGTTGGSSGGGGTVVSQAEVSSTSGTDGILGTPIASGNAVNSSEALAMSKEKTPMCLMNELARHNQVQHQYRLIDEKGPAHKKTFTVMLRLGENEEYVASGASIKKAQHAAAAIALDKTQYKHPPPKVTKQNRQTKLTPTVELNAVAMKRGETAEYLPMDPPRHHNPYNFGVAPNLRTMYNQKYYGRPPLCSLFFVTLRVGQQEFVGEGSTIQQAKHNAAAKALKVLKALPIPENTTTCSQELAELDPNAELKSPISLVHEVALKRSLNVNFEVVKESGPPHMRSFVTVCIVGDVRTEGEGTGKKASKKKAAEAMLEELKKLPPVPAPPVTRVKRKPTVKKKSRNLIKEQKAAPEYGQGINPISRLIQIQQAKKEKEPIYTLIAERGVPRRREFIIQVTVGGQSAQGSGPNKKLAKRAAAESMLQLLGYSRPQPQPGKPAIKTEASHSDPDKTRKVTFLEEGGDSVRGAGDGQMVNGMIGQTSAAPSGSGRQIAPGLIMMPDGSALHGYQQMQQSGMVNLNPGVNVQATATIAQELLKSGNSPTAEAMSKQKPVLPNNQGPAQVLQASQQQPPGPPTSNQLISQPQPMAMNPQPQGPPPQPPPAQSHTHPPPPQQQQQTMQSLSQPSQQQSMSVGATTTHAVRPKDQLMYLAQILDLQVQFTDFPKGNKSAYLSLVSLSTNPPKVSHGYGPTIEASHDQACLAALHALAEMGLDTVTGNSKTDYSQNGV